DAGEADKPRRPEYASLHHQHQRGAAGHRPDGRIVGVEQADGFLQRLRLCQFKRRHQAAPPCANAAASRAANCFSISRAFDRSTGCPRLPSLPVKFASTEYAILVSSPASVSVVTDVAVMRPTMPMGVPSTVASISRGGSARVTATVTLNANFM